MTQKSKMVKISMIIASTIIAIVIGELFLVIIAPSKTNYVWTPNFSTTLKVAEETMPGVKGDSKFTINEEGLRGDLQNEAASLKILTIGGSTTECFYLDDAEAWPFLVQQSLNTKNNNFAWVGNLGRSGLNSTHHILELQKGIDQYESLDIIVFMVGINDLIRDINYAEGVVLEKRSLIEQTFMAYSQNDSLSFLQNLELYQLINRVFKEKEEVVIEHHTQDVAGKIYDKWRTNRQNNKGIIDTIPHLITEKNSYKKKINKLIELCKEKNIEPIFLLQPTMYRDSLEPELAKLLWFGGVGDFQGNAPCFYYSVSVLMKLMNNYNGIVAEVCKNQGVSYLDLPNLLPKNTESFYDDCHFNEKGSKKMAQLVSNFILTKYD